MKIELDIKERLAFLSLLPKEGMAILLRCVQRSSLELAITEEDIKDFDIVMEDGNAKWNPNKDTRRSFDIEPTAIDLVKKELRELDKNEKLSMDFLGLYNRLIGD